MHTKNLILASLILVIGLVLGVSIASFISGTDYGADSQYLSEPPIDTSHSSSTPTSTPPVVIPQESPDTPVESGTACTMDAKLCPDGVTYVGRVAPGCAFAECPLEDDAPTAPVVCTPEQKEAEACIEIYAPVCGAVRVECVTTPCNPVPQTFSNSCFACAEDRVISYTEGACAGDPTSY
jgi:hypothetical protein